MPNRADEGLAFILQYENVAWYEEGSVRILDRRVYPMETSYVNCKTHQEVAQAIKDMVTQSGGPYTAAGMGMALAAWECRDKSEAAQRAYMTEAADRLANARPTTARKMRQFTDRAMQAAERAWQAGTDVPQAVFEQAVQDLENKYHKYEPVGELLASRIPQGGTVMTQCWGETVIGMMLRACRKANKEIHVICPETRPYFQGSRLTASCVCDMGFDVTVISDNMPAYVMHKKNVDVFTSASDVITLDGYVVNKVGTFQFALAAHYWGIPYFATGFPNPAHPTIDTVTIEERDPELVLHALDTKVTMDGVKGYYPAFDITPPRFVSGIVTDRGILSPYSLKSYFE